MNKRLAGLLLFLGAAVALGAAEGTFDRFAEYKPILFKKGIYVGLDQGANRVVNDTTNKLTQSKVTYLAWDFPAVGINGSTTLSVSCSESATKTAAGVKITDTCNASTDLGVDGGAALSAEAWLTCRALTDGVVWKLCAGFTDGGSYNLGDAGFYARTFSFQPQ